MTTNLILYVWSKSIPLVSFGQTDREVFEDSLICHVGSECERLLTFGEVIQVYTKEQDKMVLVTSLSLYLDGWC